MARIGILGGTFDPPHNAHLMMARTARTRIPLDRVLVMPAPSPPHKKNEHLTPYAQRVEMARIAIGGVDGIEVSTMEEFRDGPSYTVDLVEHYKQRHDNDLYLIVGSDSVAEMGAWKEPQRLLSLVTLVVFMRIGFSPVVPVEGDAAVIVFEEPVIDVSSSTVRELVKTGRPIDHLVPKSVSEFILDNSLYS